MSVVCMFKLKTYCARPQESPVSQPKKDIQRTGCYLKLQVKVTVHTIALEFEYYFEFLDTELQKKIFSREKRNLNVYTQCMSWY